MRTKEEWRDCGEGYYEVSDRGRVRRAKPGPGTHAGRMCKPRLDRYGYHKVTLCVGTGRVTAKVHRIVAEAFLGPCPDGMQVNHIDANKLNNTPSNLEYLTAQDNMKHAFDAGLIRHRIPGATVDEIRTLRSQGMAYVNISKQTGVSADYCRQLAKRHRRAAI